MQSTGPVGRWVPMALWCLVPGEEASGSEAGAEQGGPGVPGRLACLSVCWGDGAPLTEPTCVFMSRA